MTKSRRIKSADEKSLQNSVGTILSGEFRLCTEEDVETDLKFVGWKGADRIDLTLDTYTGCPRRNVPVFGRVFLMLKYTGITQNTYVQS